MRSVARAVLRGGVAALLLAAAFAAGRWSAPTTPAAGPRPDPTPRAALFLTAPPTERAAECGSGLEDIRLAVRQELAVLLQERGDGGEGSEVTRETPPEPAPPSAAERAAADQLAATLDAAMARGRFTAADRDRWVELLERLPPAEQFQAERRLAVALNRDGLRMDPDAIPMGPAVR